MKVGKKPAGGQAAARLLFLAYGVLMLWLLFGQRIGPEGVELFGGSVTNLNLQPFKTIKMYANIVINSTNGNLLRHALINLAGNVVMFVPLGALLPGIWKRMRGVLSTFLSAALLILLVEAVQYVTGLGSCDIDDLILNLAGVVLGYGMWKLSTRIRL